MSTTANHNQTNHPEEPTMSSWANSDDHRQFSKLYDRYSACLYGLIFNRVKDKEAAENLLQDIFLKAWRCRQQYDATKGSLFTWLYNITRNICIDYLRSKSYKYYKASQLSDDISSLLPAMTGGSENPDAIGLRKLVEKLSKGEKQVIELMYFNGYTQKEIAQIMDTPLGTVKTRMSRAIRNLRNFFKKDWEESLQQISLN
jgi:RNA polymerase sigma-70 factor (ECF subfamily)